MKSLGQKTQFYFRNKFPLIIRQSAFMICGVMLLIWLIISLHLFLNDEGYFRPSHWAYLHLYRRCPTCSVAKQVAFHDFRRGNYLLVLTGLPEESTYEAANILNKKYAIKTVMGGCVTPEPMQCYTNEMNRLLYQKYDKNMYHTSYLEAESIINERHKTSH